MQTTKTQLLFLICITPILFPSVVNKKINVVFIDYGDESDLRPYPIPLTTPIEGNGAGDAHAIAVDFETKNCALRPETWTSTGAAGLPFILCPSAQNQCESKL